MDILYDESGSPSESTRSAAYALLELLLTMRETLIKYEPHIDGNTVRNTLFPKDGNPISKLLENEDKSKNSYYIEAREKTVMIDWADNAQEKDTPKIRLDENKKSFWKLFHETIINQAMNVAKNYLKKTTQRRLRGTKMKAQISREALLLKLDLDLPDLTVT